MSPVLFGILAGVAWFWSMVVVMPHAKDGQEGSALLWAMLLASVLVGVLAGTAYA